MKQGKFKFRNILIRKIKYAFYFVMSLVYTTFALN